MGKENAGAELSPGPEGDGRTLYVHYGARKPVAVAQQMLLLPPGRYELSARAYMEEGRRGDQLRWTLTCHQGPPLADMPGPDEGLVWVDTRKVVDVPAQGCEAQRLVLSAEPGEVRTDQIRAWYDRVALKRLQ
jgi:hypothetical protein